MRSFTAMPSLAAPLVVVLTTCAVFLQLYGCARGQEGSSDGVQKSAELLLLDSGGETAVWFNASSADALRAARLASDDIARDAQLGALQHTFLKLTEKTSRYFSQLLNLSVVGVASVECAGDTCHTYQPLRGLPIVSASPSCLRRNTTAAISPNHVFCMLPSLDHFPGGVASLIAHYGWQRVAVITESASLLVADEKNISIELKRAGVGDIRTLAVSSQPHHFPHDILHRDYRIVVLNLTPPLTRRILCEALHQNLHRHVLITPGWFPHLWWRQGGDPIINSQSTQPGCSDEELEKFMSGSERRRGRVVSVLQSPLSSLSNTLYAGFQERCREDDIADCDYAGLAYDAVWAIADALANSMSDPPEKLGEVLRRSNFSGVSGQVEFDPTAHRVLKSYTVGQLRIIDNSPKNVPIATITKDQAVNREGEGGRGGGGGGGQVLQYKFTYINNESDLSVWPDGVPLDGSPLKELRHPLLALVIICYTLSGGVILWAIICIAFNICFRKKKLIKLTSPTLNLMIAVGLIFTNLVTPMSMYISDLEGALTVFCIVRPLALAVGWSLSLCTITVKMWRVFIIYRTTMRLQTLKEKRLRKFLHDRYMVGLVLCMVVVDLIVVTVGTSLPLTRFRSGTVPDKEFSSYRNSEDIEVVYYNKQCVTDKGLAWVGFLFGYKILFIFSGMILAFLTRKIKVRGLNESREVQIVMIITTPIVVTGLILRMVLSDYLNVVGTVFALGNSLCSVTMLGIIFLPKMIYLCKNPSGDKIYTSKYHPNYTGTVESRREHSITNNSLMHSFEPSSSLRTLIRNTSVESIVLTSSDMDRANEREMRKVTIRNLLLSLPTIEEAGCSNDATTECSEGITVVNPLILQRDKEASGGGVMEDADSSTSTSSDSVIMEEGRVAMASPTEAITLSLLTEDQRRALRQSWLRCNEPPSQQDSRTNSPSPTDDYHSLKFECKNSASLADDTGDCSRLDINSAGMLQQITDSSGLLRPAIVCGSIYRSHVDSAGIVRSASDHSGLSRLHLNSAGMLHATSDHSGLNRPHMEPPGLLQTTNISGDNLTQAEKESSGTLQLTTHLDNGHHHSDVVSSATHTATTARVFESMFDSSVITQSCDREEAAERMNVAVCTSLSQETISAVDEEEEQAGHDNTVTVQPSDSTIQVLSHVIEVCT